MINPKLKRGDRVVILHMDDDISPIPMGTAGTVTGHSVVFGDDQYSVRWDNGSNLSIISSVDIWDFEDNVNQKKKKINEITSSSSGGKYRVPIVLAAQGWEVEQMGAFTIPVSKYMNADLAYDSYDRKMERTKKQISREESFERKKSKMAKKMFSQNDGDGNPINGYSPEGATEPGTPKQIKKGANLPKSKYKEVIKNYPEEEKLMKKKRMVEDEIDKFKNLISNPEVFKHFNIPFLRRYLIAVRDSGIVNMFESSPFLYLGRERIEHEFKYKRIPDEDKFEDVLNMADQSQAEMINGVIKYLEATNKEPDLNNINRYLQRFANTVVQKYMLLF